MLAYIKERQDQQAKPTTKSNSDKNGYVKLPYAGPAEGHHERSNGDCRTKEGAVVTRYCRIAHR